MKHLASALILASLAATLTPATRDVLLRHPDMFVPVPDGLRHGGS